jgi:hypothetical protein
MLRTLLLLFLCALAVQPAFAQSIGLDADGTPRIRAITLAEPLHLDGKLNEEVYELPQYSSGDNAFSSNLRFRWEYQPGSELFVVYTDERDTASDVQTRPGPVRGLKPVRSW